MSSTDGIEIAVKVDAPAVAPETKPLNLVAPAAEAAPPAGVPKPDHLPQPLGVPSTPGVAGGIAPLPVSASTQESGGGVVLDREVVATGELPPPPGKRHEKKRDYTIDDHRLTVAQVAARFQTQIDLSAPSRSGGLTTEEAARRLAAYGPNLLTPPP